MQTKLQLCKTEIENLQSAAAKAEAGALEHQRDIQNLQSRLKIEEAKATSVRKQLDVAQVSSLIGLS